METTQHLEDRSWGERMAAGRASWRAQDEGRPIYVHRRPDGTFMTSMHADKPGTVCVGIASPDHPYRVR